MTIECSDLKQDIRVTSASRFREYPRGGVRKSVRARVGEERREIVFRPGYPIACINSGRLCLPAQDMQSVIVTVSSCLEERLGRPHP